METANLKKFAQYARRYLKEQVAGKLQRVLATDSAAQRENPKAVAELKRQIAATSSEQVIDKVAYVWFNRFCALRFIDVNRYNRMGILSPADGQFQPEILAEAKMGHIDETIATEAIRRQVIALLNGSTPSPDPQGEAYRLLLVASCNDCHQTMPFLFEKIADYTELLLPDDLLSSNSILSYIRAAMTSDICEDVEVIGWLYQYYISEKKDEIINRRSVVSKEEIPAATQLFTPQWIVRYMVDNSLGRLWLMNHPTSKLAERMEYYIRPEYPEVDFLKITSPEELKVCDPACGSGHMLTYAFDLLYAIYEEEGYPPAEIPAKILTHNLYGIEIDERAGSLAAFALAMKARAKNRSFFRQKVNPNICVLENVRFESGELQAYMDAVGRDLFTASMEITLRQFEEADNFGSLIHPMLTDTGDILRLLRSKDVSSNLFLQSTHERVLKVLRQSEYLSPKYHVVIANPPYAGSRYMNLNLRSFAQKEYPEAKSDMFTMFIERICELTQEKGVFSIVCPFVWMYISTFEKFREKLLQKGSISSLVRLEYNAFEPACVPVAAWVFVKGVTFSGLFIDLSEFKGCQNQAPRTIEAINDKSLHYCYNATTQDFINIPGAPIAYQTEENFRRIFTTGISLGKVCDFTGSQNITGDNNQFVKMMWEVSHNKIGREKRWVPYAKGGGERKWYGLLNNIVDWSLNARYYYKNNPTSNLLSENYWFRSGVTYSMLTSNTATFRMLPEGCIYDKGGPSFHPREDYLEVTLLACNSVIAARVFNILNPTLNLQVKDVKNLPLPSLSKEQIVKLKALHKSIVALSMMDWNNNEISIEYNAHPLLLMKLVGTTNLQLLYSKLRAQWGIMVEELSALEKENNRIFIEAYKLQDKLTPDVSQTEITLTCNPHYRFGSDKTEAELEALLLADTMKEFISYAVGSMFGRYALEKPGLILANQGETLEDYLRQIPEPSFPADRDNVIPIIEGDWFAEDIAARFRKFLRLTFGEDRFAENLRFIEEALGKDIGKYFAKDFYNDHVKRYKKRPIYWLFSSPKGSFNALIYMHRYRPDTVSVVLNDYLREYRTKLSARKAHLEQVSISGSVSVSEKTKALKEIESLKKVLNELMQYERDVLYPLAAQKLEIDLDDGVKVNYLKFGAALRKIPGLDAVEE